MKTSESITKIASAINNAQKGIKAAEKTAVNPFFKSNYADLSAVWDSVKGPLQKEGIALCQGAQYLDGTWQLVTRMLHTSGEWVETYYPLVAGKQNDPQAMGAAVTYARRYALKAILSVPDADDDGESAVQRTPNIRAAAKVVSSGNTAGVIPFGKHKGQPFAKVPFDYLTWLKGSLEEKNDPRNEVLLTDIKNFLAESQSVPVDNGSDFANQDIPF